LRRSERTGSALHPRQAERTG